MRLRCAFHGKTMPNFFRTDFVDTVNRREPHDLPFAIVDPAAESEYLPRIAIVEKTQVSRDLVPIFEELRVAFGSRGKIARLVYHHDPADRGHHDEHADDQPAVDGKGP